MQLLRDMRVVSVKEQSGVYVLSADSARRYLQTMQARNALVDKKYRLRALLEQQESLTKQVSELCRSILDEGILPVQAEQSLPNYAVRVPAGWAEAGRNLGELHFWQATGATVVAIRRGGTTILSPGPYAELYAGDSVVFVGDADTREAVARYFSATTQKI